MIAKFKMRKVHQEEKSFRLTAKHSDGGGPSSQLELFMAELRAKYNAICHFNGLRSHQLQQLLPNAHMHRRAGMQLGLTCELT